MCTQGGLSGLRYLPTLSAAVCTVNLEEMNFKWTAGMKYAQTEHVSCAALCLSNANDMVSPAGILHDHQCAVSIGFVQLLHAVSMWIEYFIIQMFKVFFRGHEVE